MGKCRLSGLLPALLAAALLMVPGCLLCQQVADGASAVRQVARVALNSSRPGLHAGPDLVRLPETTDPERAESWSIDRTSPPAPVRPAHPLAGSAAFAPSLESPVSEWMQEMPVLPSGLHGEVRTITRQVREIGDRLFGSRGMVSMGTVEQTDQPRLRLNLQYEPEPGLRVTLLTG